nr:hypothetical protein [Rhodoferax sp.]
MKKLILWCVLLCSAQASLALAPYVQGSKLPAADLPTQLAQVEKKLQAEGFTVIGRHTSKGLPQHASLVVTDRAMLEAIRSIGGSAVIASGIRVGVKSDGTVSYMNPDYWYRAYLRTQFKTAQTAVKSVQMRLAKALGEGSGFGGDVAEADLSNYRYMFGMERFDSANSELSTHASFEEALKTVQGNLSKGVGSTSRVYEVLIPGSEMAVFGVAMNDPGEGEGWWVNKIGADHVAGLPYEVFIVGNKVYALYARYRIALAWPALGMGQFMGIINAPEAIRATLTRVAGGAERSN